MAEILLFPTVKKIWNFLGFNLERTTWLMNFYITLVFFLVLIIIVLSAMVLILEEIDLNSFADAFESCAPNYQLLCKIVINRYEIEAIRKLLKQMEEKFWPTNKFDDAKIQAKQMRIYTVIKHSYTAYRYLMYCSAITICVRPLFLEKRIYPLVAYNIVDTSNNYFYCSLYGFQIIYFVYGVSIFLAVEGLFALFVINVLCQVIMLKHGFESLKIDELNSKELEEARYERLKEYVDHHNLILEFIEKLNKLYSIQMFNQFLGNTVSICMGIYIISATGNIATQIRSCMITTAFIVELAMYCIGGTLVTQACLEIAESMYYSGWEGNNHKRFRTACSMIVMRAQKEQSLKAGGLFDINVITLTSILQASFSFYTLMNNVKNDT